MIPKNNTDNKYPGFQYPAAQLSAFTCTIGIFIISLVDGRIIHHTPDNAGHFEAWLISHGVRDIRKYTPRMDDAGHPV